MLRAAAEAAAVEEEMEAGRRPSPTLELAEIFEFQIVELNKFAKIQSGLLIAVVERGEFSGVRAAVGEFYVGLIPILKRKLAFDAFVVRDGDGGDDVSFTVPCVSLLDLNLRRGGRCLRRHFRSERDREFVLRVGEPGATAVIHHDVPFIPAALLVFIQDSAGDDECFVFVDAFGIELNRRAVWRQVGDLADFFDVHIGTDEDAFAVGTDSLHAAGPLKSNLGSAVRAIRDGLRHR